MNKTIPTWPLRTNLPFGAQYALITLLAHAEAGKYRGSFADLLALVRISPAAFRGHLRVLCAAGWVVLTRHRGDYEDTRKQTIELEIIAPADEG